MRTIGSPGELERRRLLAVQRVQDGYSPSEVAEFLGIDPSSVRRWLIAFRIDGTRGLAARPVLGRPRKLDSTQEKIALRWLTESPTVFGFDTELWTAARFADLLREEWGVELNPRYVCRWLRERGFSPQRPQRVPRERRPEVIAAWLETEWTRIKKKRSASAAASFSSTKAGF